MAVNLETRWTQALLNDSTAQKASSPLTLIIRVNSAFIWLQVT